MLIGASWLVLLGGAWVGIYLPTFRILTLGMAAGTLLAWLVVSARNAEWRPRSALMPWIAIAIASLAISTIFSRVPRISLEYLGYALVLAALYLLLVRIMAAPELARWLLAFCVVIFGVVSFAYIVLSVQHWVAWWSAIGHLAPPPLRPAFESLTYGNPSEVLTVIALLAVPIVATRPTTTRGAVAIAAVLTDVAVVALLSGSRGGWFGLAIAAVVLGLLTLRVPAFGARRAVAELAARPPALVGLAAIALLVTVLLAPGVIGRVTAGGGADRVSFVTVSLDLFGESPVVGTGPGTWVIERARHTPSTDPDVYIPHAHNIYAQTLAELGIVGAIAGALLVVGLLRLLRGAITGPSPSRRQWGVATTIGLVYFAAHQAIDFYANMPAVLFLAAIPVAHLDATSPERAAVSGSVLPPTIERLARPVVAVALAIAFIGLMAQEIPALRSANAVNLANAGQWAEADADARAAAAIDPVVAAYSFTAGLTAARAGDHVESSRYFEAVARQDDLAEAWLNLAAERVGAGDENVAADIRTSLRLGRQRTALAMPAGDLALRIGEHDLAIQAFAAAISVTPSLAADPWWRLEPVREDALQGAVELLRSAGGLGWEVLLMSGDTQGALDAATDPVDLDFIRAWAGDAEAHERLIRECETDDPELRLIRYCARLADRAGQPADAARYRYIAEVQLATPIGGSEVRVVDAISGSPRQAGDPPTYYGAYTYRRFTPWDMLVPSLVHLEYQ